MVRALSIALGIVDGLNQGVAVRGGHHRGSMKPRNSVSFWEKRVLLWLGGSGRLVSCASLPTHKGYLAGRAICPGKIFSLDFLHELQALLKIVKEQDVELPITEAVIAIAMGKYPANASHQYADETSSDPE